MGRVSIILFTSNVWIPSSMTCTNVTIVATGSAIASGITTGDSNCLISCLSLRNLAHIKQKLNAKTKTTIKIMFGADMPKPKCYSRIKLIYDYN